MHTISQPAAAVTAILVRKFARDVRPALAVICLLLFLFSALWVKIAQRVTTEISPVFNVVMKLGMPGVDPKKVEKVLFKGPGRVSQAVLGGSDIQFERPQDFLAVALLHPVVLILVCIWAVGRSAGAVAGELDRGTMELLLSQPVPRSRLLLAHLIVDLGAILCICLTVIIGTQAGLAMVGPFVVDYSVLKEISDRIPIPETAEVMEVTGRPQVPALSNLAALMFAVSGVTMALSAAGRSRWRVIGLAVLIVMTMFTANVVGQLWDSAAFLRPFTLFYYYQPQRIMLKDQWTADLGEVWNHEQPLLEVPIVGVLFAVGALGYLAAWRIFTRRDLPAPL